MSTTDSEVKCSETQTVCLTDLMHIKRGRIRELVESKSSHLRSQTPSPWLFVAPVCSLPTAPAALFTTRDSEAWTLTFNAASRPRDRWRQSFLSSHQIIHILHAQPRTHAHGLPHCRCCSEPSSLTAMGGGFRTVRESGCNLLVERAARPPTIPVSHFQSKPGRAYQTLCSHTVNWKNQRWSRGEGSAWQEEECCLS